MTPRTAFAPGGVGNLGPGLDILGCALTGPGDLVEATLCDEPGVHIVEPGHPRLPREASAHASGIAAAEVLRRAGKVSSGVELRVTKQLPLSGGQGGSAASAVAGAMATDAAVGARLPMRQLLECALLAEEQLSGRHADNVAPILMGGIVLVRSVDPLDVVRLAVPDALRVVIAHPDQELRTADARAVLPPVVSTHLAIRQAANVAAMVAALEQGDLRLLGRALEDGIAEPARAPLLRGFAAAKHAALEGGALGCSISGAGPSSFAFTDGDEAAVRVAGLMEAAYLEAGVSARVRVARVDTAGARLLASPAAVSA